MGGKNVFSFIFIGTVITFGVLGFILSKDILDKVYNVNVNINQNKYDSNIVKKASEIKTPIFQEDTSKTDLNTETKKKLDINQEPQLEVTKNDPSTLNENIIIEDDSLNKENIKFELESNGFVLNAQYISNNQWNYNISGFLPTPCYGASIEENIKSNDAEIKLIVNTPSAELICSQVLKEYNFNKTVDSTEDTVFSFIVLIN